MSKAEKRKPDILMIVSDQHGAPFASCYGDPIIQTPNIDGLAAEGVLFERAYCPFPVCGPSRASYLTGRYPHDIRCVDNGMALPSDIPTMAHALAIAGYEVVVAGRVHWKGPDQLHGFERRLVGDMSESYWHAYERWVRVGEITYLTGGEGFKRPSITHFSGPGGSQYQDYDKAVLDAALAFLAQRSVQTERRPFFLMVGFMSPHYWFTCPLQDFDRYAGQIEAPPLPAGYPNSLHLHNRQIVANGGLAGISEDDVVRTRTAYYGLVTFTDRMVGHLLSALERHGLVKDSLVLYFSDHGEMAGQHGLWWKHTFYEEASRVPLIVSYPGRFPAGRRVADLVSLVDILPSLCDWTGAPRPPRLAGQSLDPLMHGGRGPQERAVFSELCGGYPGGSSVARMVRQGPWKYNYYYGQRAELFHLDDDPDELRDLASDPAYLEVCRQLEKLLLESWDPQAVGAMWDEYREVSEYMRMWTSALNPPDPDQWDGMKPPFPEEWRQNASTYLRQW